ncbi:MAG: zf-HC2 domain-containing protein [Bacillota bacterium]
MNCQDVRQNIYTYLDGQLAASQEQGLYSHLSGCGGCQAEMVRGRHLNRLLEISCTQVEPPVDFTQRIMSRLAAAQAEAGPVVVPAPAARVELGMKDLVKSITLRTRSLAAACCLMLVLAASALAPVGQRALQVVFNPDPSYKIGDNTPLVTGPQGHTLEEQAPISVAGPGTEAPGKPGSPDPLSGEPSGERVPSVGRVPGQNGETVIAAISPQQKDAGATLKPPVSSPPAANHPAEEPKAALELPGIIGPITIAAVEAVGRMEISPLIVEEKEANIRPVWSADGKEIYYLSQRQAGDGRFTAWKATLDGKNRQLLGPINIPVTAGGGVWSPARDRLAFVEDRDGYWQVQIANLQGQVFNPARDASGTAAQRRDANPSDYWAYWPVWSAAGELAYLTTRHDSGDIMVMDVNGDTHVLTKSSGNDLYPAWSPDGSKLVFYRSQRDSEGKRIDRLYVVSRQDGEEVPLTQPIGADSLVPAWSPDGKRVAINIGFTEPQPGARQRGLWLVNADGTGLVQVAREGGGRLVSWSPDGKKIAFTDAIGRLYVVILADQGLNHQVLQVTTTADMGNMSVTWSWDSQQILFDWLESGKTSRGIYFANLPRTRPNP